VTFFQASLDKDQRPAGGTGEKHFVSSCLESCNEDLFSAA
jgi:hypothetical protein